MNDTTTGHENTPHENAAHANAPHENAAHANTAHQNAAYETAAPTLLHLDSSSGPREASVSRRLSALFAAVWRDTCEKAGEPVPHRYRYRDLAADPVPPTGPAYVTLGQRAQRNEPLPLAKVAAVAEGAAEEAEWARTRPLIEELRDAHTVLLGAPMYNLSVPACLKAWIDRITFPGAYTDPDSGESLLRDIRVVVVTARGGAYGPGTPREGFDFQEPYLRAYLESLGFRREHVRFVHAEMTRADDVPALARFRDFAARSLAEARTTVTELAESTAREGIACIRAG